MVTVRLPASLGDGRGDTILIDRPVATIDDVVAAINERVPGFAGQVAEAAFNFAVNDVVLLHRVARHPIRDGDTVEVIAAISGG